MKIVFVGGGTGGHFYPLISVAEEIERYALENQLIRPKMYYLGESPYDEKALYETNIKFVYCPAGKLRRTKDFASRIKNFFSFFQIALGALKATVTLYGILPDVVFSKGGYASFPTLLAAKFLRIPVVIHESDASMGRVTRWSANFAKYIGIAHPDIEKEFTEEQRGRIALVGIPTRKQLQYNPLPKAYDLLKLDPRKPTIAVLGGSLGSVTINDNMLDALPTLLKKYQIVHQTGKANIKAVQQESAVALKDMRGLNPYIPVPFLNEYDMRALYTVADVIITRAGSGTLFEIAEWGIPAIVIPISEEVSHDQVKNAYSYARNTGAVVIEEQNLFPHLLIAQIEQIISDPKKKQALGEQAKTFATPDAGEKLAKLLVRILKSHEL